MNYSSLEVKGGVFGEDGCVLDDVLERPLNLLYGRNGSGKSTIARFFKNAGDLGEVHVFDEDYIRDNMRIKKDGLQSIVMFGARKRADDEVGRLNAEIDKFNKDIFDITQKIPGVETGVEDLAGAVWNNLKSKSGYTKRRSLSEGYKTNRPYIDSLDAAKSLIPLIYDTRSDDDVDSLDVMHEAEELQLASGKIVEVKLPDLDRLSGFIDDADRLLQKALKSPDLNDTDRHIIELVTSNNLGHYIHETRSVLFTSPRPGYCPLCQQPLSDEYLDSLMLRVSAILNEEADAFAAEIDGLCSRICIEDFDEEKVKKELGYDFSGYYDARYHLDIAFGRVKLMLGDKKNNLYSKAAPVDKAVRTALAEYVQAVRDIEKAVSAHNVSVRRVSELRAGFERRNLRLAYQENQGNIDNYMKGMDALKWSRKRIKELEDKVRESKVKVEGLLKNGADLKIALGKINEMLDFVFYDERIHMVADGDRYVVKIYNKDINPDMLSTGEQNVLALAYFFASLAEKDSEAKVYGRKMTVVIDDPISSFDEGNRLGMISMLNYQLRSIFEGNRGSRILVMTHDMRTLEDLMAGRLNTEFTVFRVKHDRDNPDFYLRLENGEILKDDETHSSYADLISNVYVYGFEGDRASSGIGNQIRRLLETYCSFNYKSGFEGVYNNFRFFDKINNEFDKKFFKSFPLRLSLNRQSHAGEVDLDIDKIYSDADKRSLARAAILFLFKQDEKHIERYLSREIAEELSERDLCGERII